LSEAVVGVILLDDTDLRLCLPENSSNRMVRRACSAEPGQTLKEASNSQMM
jgi:hypothetical protein